MLTLSAPEMTALVGGLRVLDANAGGSDARRVHRPARDADQRLLRQPARHGHGVEGDLGSRGRVRGPRSRRAARSAGPAPGSTSSSARAPSCGPSPRSTPSSDAEREVRPRLRGRLDQGHEPRPLRPRLTLQVPRKWSRCRAERDICSIFGCLRLWARRSARAVMFPVATIGQEAHKMTDTTSRLTVEGPITGGDHGWPFGRPLFDLADRGYVAEEFFLSATRSRIGRCPAPSGAATGTGVPSPTGRCRSRRVSSSTGRRIRRGSTAPSSCRGTTSPRVTSCSAPRAPSSSKVATPSSRRPCSASASPASPRTARGWRRGTRRATAR